MIGRLESANGALDHSLGLRALALPQNQMIGDSRTTNAGEVRQLVDGEAFVMFAASLPEER